MDDQGINPSAIEAIGPRHPARKEDGGHHV
jgi:hypothetical protein